MGQPPNNSPNNPQWLLDAIAGKTKVDNNDGTFSTVRSLGFDDNGIYYLAPTIRLLGGVPTRLSPNEAIEIAKRNKDALPFPDQKTADEFAKRLSHTQGGLANSKY